jgi:PIN domain nuclease of toxin-antitoxin system
VGSVWDAGALIMFEKGQSELLRALARRGDALVVPTSVLAQVWRDGARQARLAALLRASFVEEVPLDSAAARAIGAIIARTGHPDVVDVHVALLARQRRLPVLTTDAGDLKTIDPQLEIVQV